MTHDFGKVSVPPDPRRALVGGNRFDLETVVALGLRPIAMGREFSFTGGESEHVAPWVPFDADGVEVFEADLADAEKIATYRPDLIITRGGDLEPDSPTSFAPLSKVAGVLPTDQKPWREDLEQIGGWLGRMDRLAESFAEYDELITEIKAKHTSSLTSAKVAFGSIEDPGLWLANLKASSPAASSLTGLGGTPMPFEEGKDFPGWLSLSLENLPMLADADALLFWAPDQANIDALEKNPLWQRIPAVRAGRVVLTTNNIGHGSIYTVMETARIWDEVYTTLA